MALAQVGSTCAALAEETWPEIIGEDYIELALHFARESDPGAIFLYNDFGAGKMRQMLDELGDTGLKL